MPATAKPTSTRPEAQWIGVTKAAKILDMSKRTVRHLCTEGELPAEKFGRAWRIRRGAVLPDSALQDGGSLQDSDPA